MNHRDLDLIATQKLFMIPENMLGQFIAGLSDSAFPQDHSSSYSATSHHHSRTQFFEYLQTYSGSQSIDNVRCNDPLERSQLMIDGYHKLQLSICSRSGLAASHLMEWDENMRYHLIIIPGRRGSEDLYALTSSQTVFRYRKRTSSSIQLENLPISHVDLIWQQRIGEFEMRRTDVFPNWSIASSPRDQRFESGVAYQLQFDIGSDFFLFNQIIREFPFGEPQIVSVALLFDSGSMSLLKCMDDEDLITLTRSLSHPENMEISPQLPVFKLTLCQKTGIRLPQYTSPGSTFRLGIKWRNRLMRRQPITFFTRGPSFTVCDYSNANGFNGIYIDDQLSSSG